MLRYGQRRHLNQCTEKVCKGSGSWYLASRDDYTGMTTGWLHRHATSPASTSRTSALPLLWWEMSPPGASLQRDPESSQIWKPLHHSAHKLPELWIPLPKHTKLIDEAWPFSPRSLYDFYFAFPLSYHWCSSKSSTFPTNAVLKILYKKPAY